jgi:DNA-binding transcriptional MocR family regulator
VCSGQGASGRVALQLGGSMLTYVPVVFDVYRPLKTHLRWTMQCLVGFADKTGRCFPSVRTLAEVAGLGKSTVARHLAELEKAGALSRRRRPGGVYVYQVDARFLPAARLSHLRKTAVPRAPTKEYFTKNRSDSGMPDDRSQWRARMRQWEKARFWLPQWGPKPGEAGCFAPIT